MTILFITMGNLATNPRLYKELLLAISKGYECHVVYGEFGGWSYDINRQLVSELKDKVHLHPVSTDKSNLLKWGFSHLQFRVARKVASYFPENISLLSASVTDRLFYLLLNKIDSLNVKADMVVAHNLVAFYPAVKYAEKHGAKLGIDIEDYHPGQANDAIFRKKVETVFNYAINKADYITGASKLILAESIKGLKVTPNTLTINNVFPQNDFVQPYTSSENNRIKLVWFSQVVNKGRGLEELLELISKDVDRFELHLYGSRNEAFYETHLKDRANVFVHKPVANINEELSKYDIGMALEMIDADFNRDICLTNKIWAYYQSGLYILATDTRGQVDFIKDNPEHGTIMSVGEYAKGLKHAINNIDNIRANNNNRYKAAMKNSWTFESEKLGELWERLSLN